MIKEPLILLLLFLIFIPEKGYSLALPYPQITIMEYTKEADAIVYGEIAFSVIMKIEPDEKLCLSQLVGCHFLKGNSNDTLRFYTKQGFSDFHQGCQSAGPVIIFLKLYKDTLFTINEIPIHDGNKTELLEAVKKYVSYEKIADKTDKEKAYCSLILYLLKSTTLKEEASQCIWNASKGKAEKGRKTPIFFEDCFSDVQKNEFVNIAQGMEIKDFFDLNILEIAYPFDSRKIGKKLFSFLSQNTNCDTMGLSKEEKEDREYYNAKSDHLQEEVITILCHKLPAATYNDLLKAYKKETDCTTKRNSKEKLIGIIKKENHRTFEIQKN